ncbi:hemicentin-2-like [Maniola hyperantus]|uniref:hemicentin-2-like n=1 Tax=Aphantopus hyperantus TaxID=2795564 RepID=UPI0015681918|nr:hemicentin-1-like [Maniola hyperantus]
MMFYKEIFILLHFYLYLQSYFVDCVVKSSLVFVIDDTGSMAEEIDGVKQRTYEVFDAVLSSNGSAIDDFVLVTFNDPGTQLRMVTRDKYAYKREVQNIQIHGGGDCPELAMSGIELALENSKPNSLLYVFTDASAKDYNKFERVKSLSQKKSTQVTFLLTGLCGDTTTPDYLVFEKLSEATSGQVFNIERDDVKKVIDYIIETIKHKKTTLDKKTFRSGVASKNMTFSVDSKIWDVMVSVSAANPEFRILGPDNAEVAVEKITATATTSIGKLKTNPGVYTIIMNSDASSKPTSVVITGSTAVTFRHGFSPFIPSTINETSTKPMPDELSVLSIQLDNNKRDVLLKTVEIRDENDRIIYELPLEMVNDDQQFYITQVMDPPTDSFKIVVHGYTPSNEKITRISPTTVEYQKPNLVTETVKNLAPKVTILGEAKTINAEYKKPLTIHCKVMAYPAPDVIYWLDEKGIYLPLTPIAVDLPYEYISILYLRNVEENSTQTCLANNTMGQDRASVNIEIKTFFNVLEYPTDATIEYRTTAQLKLKIESLPPATIVWLKDDDVLRNNEYFSISEDNSTLTIKDMQPAMTGSYTVEASNGFNAKRFDFEIFLSGAEPPKIDSNMASEYRVEKGSSAELSCRVISGKPEPEFYWSFDKDYTGNFEIMQIAEVSSTESSYNIDKVDPKVAGAYKCTAYNDFGEDSREMDLFVEYPPTVEINDAYLYKASMRAGELIQIPCYVDGVPTPTVRWLIDGLEINVTNNYKIYKDNTLSFRSSVDDRGVYTCEASNPLGKSRKDVHLDVFVPVNIESPKQSLIELKVGDLLALPCQADGFPKPNIKWMFFSKDSKIAPKSLRKDITNSIVIDRVQLTDEGLYTCVASNAKSLSNITYEVNVKAPPTIFNTLRDKTIEAVKGDLVLRLPCIVDGHPKPTVTWTFGNGLNVVTGTEWYDVEEDGTLIIKNIDEDDAGDYICKAENPLGSSFEDYKVIVLDSPTSDGNNGTMLILEKGQSFRIDCGMSHKKSDLIRWFKDGRFIKNGDLALNNVQMADSGTYSCRVSNFKVSHSSHYHVIVGFKPKFISDEETNIDFIADSVTALSCDARGAPKPKIQWWKNNQLIEETSMIHVLFMENSDIGQYTCRVRNEFGNISRTFNIIVANECTLNIDRNFEMKQPLLLSSEDINLPALRSADGLLKIPAKHSILMFCPNSFINIDGIKFGDHLNGTCVDNSILNINGINVDFANIRCNDKIVPLTKSTGVRCGPGSTELLNIGYDIGFEFVGIYDVCINKHSKLPLYTKFDMYPIIEDTIPNEKIEFVRSKHLPFQFEDMYNCLRQRNSTLSLTGKRLSTDNRCCFAKRQLVNPRDVVPGYQQVATYNYLNVIPKWGTCGTENWDEVEERVRSLVKALGHPLEVYTGSSHLMKLPAQPKENTVHLVDRFNRQQPVPRYTWKVIVDHYEANAVAIIQINIPDITLHQAFSFMLCKDICHQIEWMKSTEWRDVKKGFTFCCKIKDFETAFGYKDTIFKIRELSSKVLII